MSDPQHLGLGELGQRLQAMSDPAPQPAAPTGAPSSQAGSAVPGSGVGAGSTGTPFSGSGIDSRLRPYQGAPLPVGPLSSPVTPSNPAFGNGSTSHSVAPSTPAPATASAAGTNSYPFQPFESRPLDGKSFESKPFESLQSFGGSVGVSNPAPELRPQSASSAWEQVSTHLSSLTAMPAANGSDSHGSEPNPLESIAYGQPPKPASAAGNAPSSLSNTSNESTSGLHRALNAVRSTIPLVQRLLPLLEGNFANALGALINPQPHAPAPVQVDMEPVERGLAEVRNSNRELKAQVQEQGTTLKRVEDQLERVREATDRNTLEQQELVEDLRAVGSRISTFAIIGIALLVISLGLNVYFLIELQHILR